MAQWVRACVQKSQGCCSAPVSLLHQWGWGLQCTCKIAALVGGCNAPVTLPFQWGLQCTCNLAALVGVGAALHLYPFCISGVGGRRQKDPQGLLATSVAPGSMRYPVKEIKQRGIEEDTQCHPVSSSNFHTACASLPPQGCICYTHSHT